MPNEQPEGKVPSLEVGELTPDLIEEQAREIAERYLATIKPGENILTKPEEVRGVLACEREIQREYAKTPGCSAFTTTDKLGNMPGNTYSLLMADKVDQAVAYVRTIVADPVAHADEIDKANRIAKSALPESIKRAILAIMLTEGDHSFQPQFQELLARIEESEARTKSDVFGFIHDLQKDERYTSRQHDHIRTRAVEIVLERLFSWMAEDPAYALLSRIWIEEDDTKEGVKKTVKDIVALAGDIPVDPKLFGQNEKLFKLPKKISGFASLLEKSRDPFASSPQVIASFVGPMLTRYCEFRLLRAQNIHLLKQYRKEILESQGMLGEGWTLEERPRHKIGRIITELWLPIVMSDMLIDQDAYDALSTTYQNLIEKDMPKKSQDPEMDEKLAAMITATVPFIDQAIQAFKDADMLKKKN